MSLNRDFNPKYIVELMYGAKLATDPRSMVNPQAARDDFIKLVQKDIRGQIENTLPIIYLVKPEEIVINQLNGLVKQNSEQHKDISKVYIESVQYNNSVVTPEDSNFKQALDNNLKAMMTSSIIKDISSKLYMAIDSKMLAGKEITLEDLGKETAEILKIVQNAEPDINVICSIGKQQDIRNVYDVLSNDIQRAGNKLRSWLRQNTPAKFAKPESFLNNFNSGKEILFLSSTFKKGREDTVNATASKVLRDEFAKYGINALPTFKVGAFTAAGHTGAIAEKGTNVQEVIGINSPIIQQTMYFASTFLPSKKASLDPFILETDHLDLSLNFKKGAVGVVKDLLTLNFSFVITQESSWNSSLGSREKTAMSNIVQNVWKIKREALSGTFKKYIQEQVLPAIPGNMRSSPTLNQRVVSYIADTLKGVTSKTTSSLLTVKNTPRKTPVSKKPVFKNISPKKTNITKTSALSLDKGIATNTSITDPANLVDLRMLINSQLQDVISANMGSGRSQNVLNYRTGRFASSARVESLSVSRQGMITAFYTYMKNPYATFSDGGRQSLPKSRDPKLLISKSIREIAQQLAIDKLRAVSL
jgi:hypothetical protein